MDFDLDDPLESDDSFFNEPKTISKKKDVPKPTENKLAEPFSFLDQRDNKSTTHDSLSKVTDGGTKQKHNVTFKDSVGKQDGNAGRASKSFDLFGDSDNYKSSAKTTDMFEDILPARPKSSSTGTNFSLDDILKGSKTGSKTSIEETAMSTQTVSHLDFSTTSRERRRPRQGSSTGLEDALGLFGDSSNKKEDISKSAEDIKTKSKAEKDVPNWLGGSLPILNKSEDKSIENIASKPDQYKTQDSPAKQNKDTINQLKPENIAMEIQNTYSSLHQQESFLLISLQLKKYEDSLAEIKSQQQTILHKQEDQFKNLVDEYILKQQITENNIRMQQERINNQIQILLSNSSSSRNQTKGDGEFNTNNLKNSNEEFKDLIHTLNQRHNEELLILEDSYKKQIDMLEKSNEYTEAKLKDEISIIKEILDEKMTTLKEKYEDEIAYFKEKIKSLEEDHTEEIAILKEKHSQIVRDLKSDHTAQLDYIKQMTQHDTDLLRKSATYSERIDAGIEMLSSNTKTLQDIEQKVIHNYDVTAVSRESSIQAKEKEIILMRNSLEKCRQAAEEERTQLFVLIRNLETKLAEQNHNTREDRWAFQQASATLVARAAALDREANFSRNMIEREREQLKTLKESLLAEQEQMIMQLTEEKLQLSSEKARIEVAGKLTNSYDVEKIKIEAETAIRITKELTEQVNAERGELHKQKTEVESQRRNLMDREKELNDKERELELLMQEAVRKLKEDKRVLSDAKTMENMYKERLKELQKYWGTITEREKKLAEEKVLLSKERLSFYSSNKSNKECVLCRSDQRPNDILEVKDIYKKVPDPDLYDLKFDLEDERESEVSKEENVSIQNSVNFK